MRTQILRAAMTHFAESGYQASTMRGIAAAAGVDAKLVHYYFGSKEALFTAVISEGFRSRGLPDLLVDIHHDSGASRGVGYLRAVLGALEDPEVGPAFLGLVRNLGTHEPSRRIFLSFVTRDVLGVVSPRLPGESPDLRLSLAGSQILGLVVARYVLQVPAIAALSRDELAELVGPTLDSYLFPA
ncbi:Transcriptional regulator, TetR family [Leucobacter sp. 7(1)]|uniref:TetR/AcrR family transcriptional regulator n=1 Tax=Leucobacter sp. 7(1) TaxID=1255613 RepID=UPI00097F146C|nr:TetR family transcriptional regulator [Leucobacter sp. 7(1)]SJN10125.1 Transcriptional regulator, TetR family [Leucobacter sp. 7(1)]